MILPRDNAIAAWPKGIQAKHSPFKQSAIRSLRPAFVDLLECARKWGIEGGGALGATAVDNFIGPTTIHEPRGVAQFG